MVKTRINKLALELNIQNDQIIDELKKQNIPVKNYMSSIDEEATSYIRDFFSEKPKGKAKKKAAEPKAKAAVKKKAATKAKAAPKSTTKAKAAPKAEPAKAKATPKAKAALKKAVDTTPKTKVVIETPVAKGKETKPVTTKAVHEKPKAQVIEDPKQAAKPKLGLKLIKPEDQAKQAPDKTAKAKEAEKKAPVKDKPKQETRKNKKGRQKRPEPVVPETVEVEEDEETFEIVRLRDKMPVRDVADALKSTANQIIKELMDFGIMVGINQSLDIETSSKVADKMGFEVEVFSAEPELEFEEKEDIKEADFVSRPPIVTIMGHVDHGKTSLLDAIRKTNITEGEKGGITQHIGAYQVKINDSPITFLDTPGHEAFTAMRARGAQVTDIVVLVVAADDGIKPQTKEAIDHSNAANVPLIVAINKIDKDGANPEEVKKQLSNIGLLPEDWGGQTIFTEVSAKTGVGIDHLLELILLQAEIMELKANPKVRAKGVVVEAKLDKGRGPVATVMVQQGVLTVGSPLIAGVYFGKVRAMCNEFGKAVKKAPPSTPVEVVGLAEVPEAGTKFMVVQDEKKARQLTQLSSQRQRHNQLSQKPRLTLDDLHSQIINGKIQELPLIIKADVQGSIQAVLEALFKLETDKVRIKIIHEDVGGITESDVLLASASNAIIIGFNIRPTSKAEPLAIKEKVDIRLYGIIYDAIEDIEKALKGLEAPKFKEKIFGRAEVREVINIPKIGTIAGCHVTSGAVQRNSSARLIRDSVVVYEGKISSLRRFKDDVKEVASGFECGITLDKFQDLKRGDIVEPFAVEEVPV
ncbi:MAG: translation initiation factor IF-2 [Nitrospinales bacterium]